jgi:hypothetical protein
MPGYFEQAPPNDKGIILVYKRTSFSNPEKYAEFFLEQNNSEEKEKTKCEKESIKESVTENITKNIENIKL